MGENVLESQAKNTKKRRARRAAGEQQRDLFERPEKVTDEFTVDRVDVSPNVNVGDTLLCFPGKGDAPVDVIHENQQVGIVKDDGGDVLRDIVQRTGCQSVVVSDVCQMTDTVRIQVKD